MSDTYNSVILEYIEKRSVFGLPTRPEQIRSQFRLRDKDVSESLKELHRLQEIRLTDNGFMA